MRLRAVTDVILLSHLVRASFIDAFEHCISYYGDISADLQLADTVSDRNYNDTITCPTSWSYPSTRGAVLQVCPPLYRSETRDDGNIIAVDLRFGNTRDNHDSPFNSLAFTSVRITNDSFRGDFDDDISPAILAPEPQVLTDNSMWQRSPSWTINGTQKAMTQEWGAYFNCQDFHMQDNNSYCGYVQDQDQNGCWTRQYFPFSKDTPAMNYTIRFSDTEAFVELYAESEFNNTNSNTQALISFQGKRDLPSADDDEFWKNYDGQSWENVSSYESLKARNEWHKMGLVSDQANMPVFLNETESGEWYSTGNATFSTEVKGMGVKRDAGIGMIILVGVLGAVVGLDVMW